VFLFFIEPAACLIFAVLGFSISFQMANVVFSGDYNIGCQSQKKPVFNDTCPFIEHSGQPLGVRHRSERRIKNQIILIRSKIASVRAGAHGHGRTYGA
jgi:hypothetical protein